MRQNKLYILIFLLAVLLGCNRDDMTPVELDFSLSPEQPSTVEKVLLDALLSGPQNLDTTEYVFRWDWDSDGIFDTKFSAQHLRTRIFDEPGEYSITLEALHTSGEAFSSNHNIVVTQGYSAPVPDFRFNPDSGNFQTEFTFDAGASFDSQEEQKDLIFRWDFNQDNRWDTIGYGDPIAHHKFNTHGSFPVRLMVSDTTSRHGEVVKSVWVNQLDTLIRPVVRIEPEFPDDKDTIRIIASDSYYEGNPDKPLRFSFKPFASGWTDPTSHSVYSWILPPTGIYKLHVRVYTEEGLFNTSEQEVVVSWSNRKPSAKILRNMRFGNINSSFEFSAWESSDIENTPSELKVRWDFEGDGVWDTQFSFEKVVSRVYQEPGVYNLTLQILDEGGLRDEASTNVHVSPHTNPMSYFLDMRDDQDYGMVEIGGKWWMGENLSFKPTEKSGPEKAVTWCYNDNQAICDVTGKLYFAKTIAEEYSGTDINDNICPKGWHLPSREEWINLILEYGFDESGKELFYEGRTDFNALLGGYAAYRRYGEFEEFKADSIYKVAYFLTNEINSMSATTVQLKRNQNEVQFRQMPAEGYYSIRCIRNE